MLACARIGAPHTVVFGGFSADALASRIDDCQAKVVITSDGGYRRGAPSALKPAVDEARTKTDLVEKVLVVRRTGQDLGEDGWDDDGRRVVARRRRHRVDRAHARGVRRRAPALRHVHVRVHRQAEGHPAHHRRLPHGCVVHPSRGVRPQARHRRLLVHRRHRLGHRPQLHRLRAAGQRRDPGALRRHPGQPRARPLVADRRAVRRHDLLHRAHRDPLVHEAGRRDPRPLRHVEPADPRLGR